MSRVSEPPRAVFAAAVEALAGSVVRALRGADHVFRLTGQLPPENPIARLAAVRVLGPDVLAPYVLAGHPFTAEDAEVVITSFATFPQPEPDSGGHLDLVGVHRLRHWATNQVLVRLGAGDPAHPYPAGACCDGGDRGWMAWTATLAGLSPLAFPGLDSPVRPDVRRRRLDAARGVTRAVLRRDYLTAARLARWLATTSGTEPMVPLFALEPVLSHLELLGGGDTRVDLEIMMARRGAGEPVRD